MSKMFNSKDDMSSSKSPPRYFSEDYFNFKKQNISNIMCSSYPLSSSLQFDSKTLYKDDINLDSKLNKLILYPTNSLVNIWNSMILIILFYISWIVPLKLAFEFDRNTWFYYDLSIDIIFLMDVVVNFFLSYEIDGILISDIKIIAINYLRGWFLIDFASSFPIDLIFDFDNLNHISKIMKTLKLPRLLKFLKLMKISRFKKMNFLTFFFKTDLNLLKLFTLLYWFIFFIHCLSCTWILITSYQNEEDYYRESWIFYDKLIDLNDFHLYIASLYFCLTVLGTQGFGNILIKTSFEKLFVILLIFFGNTFFGQLMGHLMRIFSKIHQEKNIIKKKENFFNSVSNIFHISNQIYVTNLRRIRNIDHCIENWNKKIISYYDLPSEIMGELIKNIYKKQLSNFDILKNNSNTFISKIFPYLFHMNFKPGDIIFKEGDISNYIYFVLEGEIFLSFFNEKNEKMRTSFRKGSFFNEENYKICKESAISEGFSELWRIERKIFFKLINDYPDLNSIIKKNCEQKLIKQIAEPIINYILPGNIWKNGINEFEEKIKNNKVNKKRKNHNISEFKNIINKKLHIDKQKDKAIKFIKKFKEKSNNKLKNIEISNETIINIADNKFKEFLKTLFETEQDEENLIFLFLKIQNKYKSIQISAEILDEMNKYLKNFLNYLKQLQSKYCLK